MSRKETAAANAAALPELPLAITSFGAARSRGGPAGDAFYVYGGHHGQAHHYSAAGQSGELLRLDLQKPERWDVVATGPKRQGLALVAHAGKLYRLGGFEARNAPEEEHDLWSVPDCACFDPQTTEWTELPDMPAPRSSFDAVLAGATIYVVGGWTMRGERETIWCEDACALDLSQNNSHWRPLAQPPFQRRALCVGALGGKIYVIGGMQPDGKITRETAVYDPDNDAWGKGPALPPGNEGSEDMEGFGAACCTIDDQLYVSTSGGNVLKLSADDQAWQPIGELSMGRFFHQMLPLDARRIAILGGAHMQRGRFNDVEVIELNAKQ